MRNVRVSNLRSPSSTYSHSSVKHVEGLNWHLNEGENTSSDLKGYTRLSGGLKNLYVLDIMGFPRHHLCYTAQTRLEDYEQPITGLAVGKAWKSWDSPIVVHGIKATQRQSGLTFYLWELQVNSKASLKVILEIVAGLSHLCLLLICL